MIGCSYKEAMSVKSDTIRSLAGVLKALVTAAFLCNLLALALVPMVVRQQFVDPRLYQELLWDRSLVWQEPRAAALILFLWFCGCCTAVILWQGRRVLAAILRGTPFSAENAVSLRRAAVCAFLVAAAALVRLLLSAYCYRSIRPFTTYNALFIPIFAVFGLLCLVMAALFRQAAEVKAENDTII